MAKRNLAKNKKIEIILGFRCNNNCKFCSIGNRQVNKSLEQIKREIDMAAEERPYEINFTGGEPTIRKDIFDIISYAKGKVASIRITTNGRMLSYGWFAKKLVESGLTGAIFSLHSNDWGKHDYLTSTKGSFDQLMEGMNNLSKLVNDISLNIVITSLNYEQLPEIVKMTIDKFGIRSYCIIFPTIDGNMLDHKELIPRYEDVRPYVHKALDLIKNGGSSGWVLNIPPCFLDKEEQYSGVMDLNTIMYWPEMRTDLDEKKWEGKIKIDNCKKCKFSAKCPGVAKDYYDLYMSKTSGRNK